MELEACAEAQDVTPVLQGRAGRTVHRLDKAFLHVREFYKRGCK